MTNDSNGLRDEVLVVMERAHGLADEAGLRGFGVAALYENARVDEETGFVVAGSIKQLVPFTNLITTAGDTYYAKMGTALVGTPNVAQPTKVNGMKLGTATTTPTKSTAGSANISSGSYISGSNVAFGSTYPQTAAKAGTDTGWYAIYQTTWNAGVATNGNINEVSIVIDQSNNADGSTAANTVSRATIATVNKLAGDTLQITWNHLFLGA